MSLDSVAIMGEVISWVGFGIGLPLFIVARIVRSVERDWRPVDIVVIEQQGSLVARWFADGEVRERPVRPHEMGRMGDGWLSGYVSSSNPDRIRFNPLSPMGAFLSTVGMVFLGAGALGFVVSLLPMFV